MTYQLWIGDRLLLNTIACSAAASGALLSQPSSCSWDGDEPPAAEELEQLLAVDGVLDERRLLLLLSAVVVV